MLFRACITTLVLTLILTSCTLKVGENPLPVVPVKTGKSECFSKLSFYVERFFQGATSSKKINTFFNCLDSQLSVFVKSFVGSEHETYYTFEELRDFIEEAYLDSGKISDEMMISLKEIKVWLVGGESTRFSKSEFYEFLSWLRRLKKIAITLNPHMPVIALKPLPPERESKAIFEAVSAYRKGIEELLGEVAKIPRPLPHKLISNFSLEIQKFLDTPSVEGEAKNFGNILTSFKTLLVGEAKNSEDFDSAEWKELARISPGWLSLWLRFHHQVKGINFLASENYEVFSVWLGKVLEQIEVSLEAKTLDGQPRKIIHLKDIETFLKNLNGFGVLPPGLSQQSIVALLKPLIQKVFGDFTKPLSERTEFNITESTLEEIRYEYLRWSKVQGFLYETLKISPKMDPEKIQDFFSILSERAVQEKLELEQLIQKDQDKNRRNTHVIRHFKTVVENQIPLFLPNDPRAIISNTKHREKIGLGHSYYQMSLLNLFQTGLRLIVRGYSEDHKNAIGMIGITENELQSFINDFRLLFEGLNLLTKGNYNPGPMIVLQANLFTYASKGISSSEINEGSLTEEDYLNDLLDFDEGLYFLSYMMSTSFISSKVYSSLLEKCSESQARDDQGVLVKDAFGKSLFTQNCFREHILGVLLPEIPNLPHLKMDIERLPQKPERQDLPSALGYRDLIMEIGGNEAMMGYYHLSKIILIAHFIETLITRYDGSSDTEPNHILDGKEASNALNRVFKGLLSQQIFSQCLANKLKNKDECEVKDREMRKYQKSCRRQASSNNIRSVYLTIVQRYRLPTNLFDTCWFLCLGTKTNVSRFKGYDIFSTVLNTIQQNTNPPQVQSCEQKN